MISQIIWFAGLSRAAKNNLCNSVAEGLRLLNYSVQVLDEDEIQKYFCTNRTFCDEDRIRNIRRTAYVAGLIAQNGIIVLVVVPSSLRSICEGACNVATRSCEVFVNVPLSVCEGRDVRGSHKRGRNTQSPGFNGTGQLYESPITPDVICNTESENIWESTNKVIEAIVAKGLSTRNDKFIDREKRPTLAIDFDGVIADYNGWRGHGVLGKPRGDVVEALRILAKEGWKIIIHTTRSPEEIIKYLRAGSIPFDEINKNSDYPNRGMKPVATVYWDDRALRYSGNGMKDLKLIRSFRTWSGRK